MRSILGITLLLFCVGMTSCRIGETIPKPDGKSKPVWVRTVDGWEHPNAWRAVPVHPPLLHPLTVALAELLTSAFALVAFSRTT